MFRLPRKALEKWFDSVTDGWNPIVVRELRRAVRSEELVAVTIIHLVLLAIVHYCWKEILYDISFVATFPTGIILVMLVINLLSIVGSDEMFETVPLSPKEKVDGFLWSHCLISAFFLVQALPFFAIPLAVPFSVPLRLGLLFGCFLFTQIWILIFLSFCVRKTNPIEDCFAQIVGIKFCIFIPFLFTTILLVSRCSSIIATVVFVSIAGLSIGCLAYYLSQYHFARRLKSGRRAYFLNFGIYLLWNIFWGIVAFVVVLCFSG